MIRVLFVCTGNICRSPSAHGVFRDMVKKAGLQDRIECDSAGTEGFHAGDAPDKRSQLTAIVRGYDLTDLRARQIRYADFENFNLLLGMTSDHVEIMKALAPPEAQEKIKLFLSYASLGAPRDVPDPYYGGGNGFETVLDLIEDACRGLLKNLSLKIP